MHFFIFVLLVCFLIFLYCVHVLTDDDFVFLRKNVDMEKIFNIVFSGVMVSFFTSRLFYGLFYSKDILLNPLAFLLFPYFPGLSLLGAVVGTGIYLAWLKTRKGNLLPIARIADFFSIAFLISLPIGFIGFMMFLEHIDIVRSGIQALVYFILSVVFLKFFLPRLLNKEFKEGTITFLFLACFSAINLIANSFLKVNFIKYFKNPENIMLILIFIASIGILVQFRKAR